MAAIDFPSAPTVGQEYPFGDFIYVWDGVKWTTKVIVGESGGGGGSQTFVSELPPTNADAGSTWFCTANGLTYILYADGDSTQWVEANPNYPIATGLFTPADIGAVDKTGDTMTGILLIDRGNQHIQLKENDSGQTYTIESTSNVLRFYDYTNAEVIADITLAGGFLQKVPQSSSGESLTRKDYVDASIPVRKKSEMHWTGLNTVLIAGTTVNIVTLLNGILAASGSWAPMFNPTTGKLTPFNDDRTVYFKMNLMGTFDGGSTNRALQLDFTGTVGNKVVVMRDSNISPSPNSIQFATFFSVDKDGNMALNGTEPMVTALGGNFTITEALIIAEQETTEG